MQRRHPEQRRRRCRRLEAPTTAIVVAVLLVALASGCTARAASTNDEIADLTPDTTTVARQDLTVREELVGQLGYRDGPLLVAGRDGIVTWLPAEGTELGRADVAVEINGSATWVLFGERPAWRRLAVGVADGPDIQQLNDNLMVLGYAKPDELAGERFDWRTRRAVRAWQAELGVPSTGVVQLGDVVFLPTEVRVGAPQIEPGAWIAIGQPLATFVSREQVVTIALDPALKDSFSSGLPVVVVLPDRASLDATVSSIGRVVKAPEGDHQEPTVDVEVVLSGGSEVAFDSAPVKVLLDRVLATDVLVVPVGALLASADQGFTIERLTPGGIEVVSVEPGQFARGLVEVSGALAEGDEVVVPS